jgi:hypothetical protein
MLVAIIMFSALALTIIRVGAQSLQPTSETYTWSGELVAFDPSTRIVTVKSPVVGDQGREQFPRFKPGDRIVLTWSGFDTYADGISRAVRYEVSKTWSEPFTFPVEFVAYEPDRRYATFKFVVPAISVHALGAVKPGGWVTTTAKHRAASETETITMVNPYGTAANQTVGTK